ncbi:Voltage-gated Ion Channel (VIC) Superfamily [Phytophthora cinnamomi]|uniref:Voltage-gated Ion Channel (VIC) Superfamily n=1 Tax=Phytophthora cinnamomi TaxID=4785 RepID=UPI00355A2BAF|nr:Voltage-gated Ion Channel (VIC) Superfamily [Phytophthora cinnamomi]
MNRGVTRLNPVSERSGRTSSNLPPANNTKESGLRRQSLTHEEQDSQEVHDPSKLIHDENCIGLIDLRSGVKIVCVNDALALVRLSIRFSQHWKMKCHHKPTFRSRLDCLVAVGLELGLTAVFPYPGLETFFPNERGDTFVLLSAAVFIRPISWGQLLYYPYPIRQKEKVASFSGNLEFSYRQFVIKKVLDDNPLNKLVTFYTLLGGTVAYLLHVMETIKGDCWWENEGAEVVRSEDAICYELYASDSLWMVFMTFLSIGYGDVYPKTGRGRAMIALAACLAVMLDSMFFSIIIKKFTFSTMEARVHAFLYRMELYSKKDISAVMAVQATFRYNKSYKHSLIWHQERGSNIFYRPLSDRLPNEVKKKLYASRFQKSLKQIMKYNTDGDPLNAFSKHVEVITAALASTASESTVIQLSHGFKRTSNACVFPYS